MGVTREGDDLWYFDQAHNLIGRANMDAELKAYFSPGDNTMKDLAWDGSCIWAINTSGTIKRFTPSGSLVWTISGLLSGGWGLTFDGTCLWASDPETDKIYQISVEIEIMTGDVNGDRSINVLDVLAVINHILGIQTLEGESRLRADCNGEGNINILDALGIVNVILGIGTCQP